MNSVFYHLLQVFEAIGKIATKSSRSNKMFVVKYTKKSTDLRHEAYNLNFLPSEIIHVNRCTLL